MSQSQRRLLLLCALFTVGFSRPPKTDDTLYWTPAQRLQFSDFRGRPGSTTGTDDDGKGRIAGTIIKSIVADTRRIRGKTWFVVYASMKPELSWIAKKNDSTALRHEQGHFDLCEIYARKLRSEIGSASSVDEAKKMWNQVLEEEDAEQNRYDRDNTYLKGGITPAWQLKIDADLKKRGDFVQPLVVAAKLKE